MCLQVNTFLELCSTGITFKGLLPIMDMDMSSKHLLLKLCATRITCIGFLPSLDTDVCLQIPLSENCAPHVSLLYAISPVWIRICVFKLAFDENCASQVSHL